MPRYCPKCFVASECRNYILGRLLTQWGCSDYNCLNSYVAGTVDKGPVLTIVDEVGLFHRPQAEYLERRALERNAHEVVDAVEGAQSAAGERRHGDCGRSAGESEGREECGEGDAVR